MSINDKKSILLNQFSKVDLYPVTCEKLSNGRSDDEFLKAVLEAGVKIIQLRDKVCSAETFLEKAKRFREMTSKYNCLLIINDYVDIAKTVDADGVHLGQDDMPVAEARAILGNDKIIGRGYFCVGN